MAAAAVASPIAPPTFREPALCRSSSPFSNARRADFDPAKHLAFEPPKGSKTFADLGLADSPLAPLAVTSPFPLFTREGVRELRRDILSKDALEKYGVSSHFAAFQTREHPAACAPFAHQAFSHPDVLRAISAAAGIELVPVMDIEKTHTNYQVKGEVNLARLRSLNLEPSPAEPVSAAERADAEARAAADLGQGANVVNEHHDAYPFVAVCMLSDVSHMVGGETAIRCGDGSMIKARGPEVGSCVVMQGRYVSHVALKAYNTPERITMVASFRAKDPMLPDDSTIKETIHPISRANRLNYHWTTYRLRLLSERFAIMAKQLEAKNAALVDNDSDGQGGAEVVDKAEVGAWIQDQVGYLQNTVHEWM